MTDRRIVNEPTAGTETGWVDGMDLMDGMDGDRDDRVGQSSVRGSQSGRIGYRGKDLSPPRNIPAVGFGE